MAFIKKILIISLVCVFLQEQFVYALESHPVIQTLSPKQRRTLSFEEKATDRRQRQLERREWISKEVDWKILDAIYSTETIRQQRLLAANQPTVVFDLNGTLKLSDTPRKRILREIKTLKRSGFRLVLWTGSTRAGVIRFFINNPAFLPFFDVIITREQYHFPPNMSEEEYTALGRVFQRAYEMVYGKEATGPAVNELLGFLIRYRKYKDLALFGYDLLIDNEQFHYQVEKPLLLKPFHHIELQWEDSVTGLAKRIMYRLKASAFEQHLPIANAT